MADQGETKSDEDPGKPSSAFASAAQTAAMKSAEAKTRPTRPLSAYNLFFQAERKRMLEVLPVRPKGKPRHRYVPVEIVRTLGLLSVARYS